MGLSNGPALVLQLLYKTYLSSAVGLTWPPSPFDHDSVLWLTNGIRVPSVLIKSSTRARVFAVLFEEYEKQ